MKKILAIGGAVIKTAQPQLIATIQRDEISMLIVNGGALLHDFQIGRGEVDVTKATSIPLTELMMDYNVNRGVSKHIWRWFDMEEDAPEGSAIFECTKKNIPVLVFTILGADFWHMFGQEREWQLYGEVAYRDFNILCQAMTVPFHFINMGSAVVMPEVFLKAVATMRPPKFRADVVDFLEMYRPRTRVAQYGTYYEMTHNEFFLKWYNKEIAEYVPE